MRLKPCAWFTSGATSSQCASGASGQPTRNLAPSQGAVGLISLMSVNGMVREMAPNRPHKRNCAPRKRAPRSERSFGIFRIEKMSEEGICGIVKDDHRRQQVDRNV
jgi:hypothetical protein